MNHQSEIFSVFIHFKASLAGASAGVVGTLLGFPFDSIKTRMQVSHSSMTHAAREIYSTSGLKGFFRGVASPLLSLVILNTLNFSTYASFREMLHVEDRSMDKTSYDPKVTLAAAMVGPIAAFISTPFELIKTQMQLNIMQQSMKVDPITRQQQQTPKQSIKSNSSIKATIQIVRQHGFLALYTGHGINTAREIVFLSTYFTVYEHFKHHVGHYLHHMNWIAIPFSGGFAGSIGWLVSFPLDCIKSNVQTQSYDQRRSTFSIGKELLQKRGFAGLYVGVVPSLFRAFLVSSSRFSAYESTIWMIDKYCES